METRQAVWCKGEAHQERVQVVLDDIGSEQGTGKRKRPTMKGPGGHERWQDQQQSFTS